MAEQEPNGKFLIVGGNSFTGPYMAQLLKQKGGVVIGTSTAAKSQCPKGFDKMVELDLTNAESVQTVVSAIRPDYVIHLAGISFVGHADLDSFYRINVVGTENLLSAIETLDGHVKRTLVSSSANIYGMPEGVKFISEEQVPNPSNHYAISKLAMEFVAKKYMDRMSITIARPFNYIGIGQRREFVIPKIVEAFAVRDAKIQLGTTSVERDFTAVQDTVRAYCDVLFEPSCSGHVFNVCSARPYSLDSIIEMLEEIAGYSIKVETNPAFVRKHEIKKLCGSNDKIRSFTGWQPRIGLTQAISDIYQAYLSQQ